MGSGSGVSRPMSATGAAWRGGSRRMQAAAVSPHLTTLMLMG